jgi:hypothetical protein
LIRVRPAGTFDAINGSGYGAVTSIPYVAGTAYRVVIDVDVAAQTYSATVDGTALATDYAFRVAAPAVGQMAVWHTTGGLSASGLTTSGDLAGIDTDCGGTGGSGGSGAGGTGATGAAGPAGGTGGSSGSLPAATEDDSGCGCALPGRRAELGPLACAFMALFVARGRRRFLAAAEQRAGGGPVR